MNRTRVAFFDVDGTLTTSASMFRFLRYYLAATGRPPREYEEQRQLLKAMTALGCSRETTNRAYYAQLAGAPAGLVAALAGQWFAAELSTRGFYHEPALAALRRHRADGDHTVLVSGSFPAPLHLIAADLGVDEVWCSEPEVTHGRYTGRLTGPPMIGDAKADAVRGVAAERGAALDSCVSYGDHISDLPMLKTTGSAVVVGGDATLRAMARMHGWRQLPGVLPPPPALPLPHRGRPSSFRSVPDEVPESA
ncbi:MULTISPECIES: HAD family hydrolase [unclassified Streptomyces]|uniref:HAD family hydrolase n=1 Tax=unclassified Streptomyces TaxID=2593676 RepID=UPI002E2968C5|nr:HAD family hydrolase [Streptomyces sp. NBC_00223]